MKLFKEITYGGLSKEQLLRKLANSGVQFNKYAHTLFAHSSFSPKSEKINFKLAKVNLTDLNLRNPSSLEDILKQASNLGLRPCPLDLGAFLRLQYLDQSEGAHLTIASQPPEKNEEFPTGFYIRHFEKTLWLRGYRVQGNADWPEGNEFIFEME